MRIPHKPSEPMKTDEENSNPSLSRSSTGISDTTAPFPELSLSTAIFLETSSHAPRNNEALQTFDIVPSENVNTISSGDFVEYFRQFVGLIPGKCFNNLIKHYKLM